MRWIVALAVCLGLPPRFERPAAGATGNTAALADSLTRLPSDPAPEHITNETHYLVSNERRLDFFASAVRDRGGIHLGVGSDPNYLIAGWARSDLVVVVDFDQDVVDLHGLHVLFFACAEDGPGYRRLWQDRERAEALIALRFPDTIRRARMLELYRRSAPEIVERLDVMEAKLRLAGETWYLDEDEDYAHVHRLAASGRVIAKRGDFTQPGVVRDIATALRSADAVVGSLYLSNIEQYFMYTTEYRDNMLGLPLRSDTLVLRTLPGKPAGFEYIVQQGDNFHRWLEYPRAWSVYRVRGLGRGEKLTASALFRIEAEPPG